MWPFMRDKLVIPSPEDCLPGRADPMPVPERHFVNGQPLAGPYPAGMQKAVFGLGCFWGAERVFWQAPGVWITAVGYAGGSTPNPTYEEVCHDPTQGMRQGNDVGTQYRSAIYTFSPEQRAAAETSREVYQGRLDAAGLGQITTEIREAPPFYFAEGYHQQYLAKNPHGYCGLGGTGVTCPMPAIAAA